MITLPTGIGFAAEQGASSGGIISPHHHWFAEDMTDIINGGKIYNLPPRIGSVSLLGGEFGSEPTRSDDGINGEKRISVKGGADSSFLISETPFDFITHSYFIVVRLKTNFADSVAVLSFAPYLRLETNNQLWAEGAIHGSGVIEISVWYGILVITDSVGKDYSQRVLFNNHETAIGGGSSLGFFEIRSDTAFEFLHKEIMLWDSVINEATINYLKTYCVTNGYVSI